MRQTKIVILIVLALLIIAPLISYYYLKSGADYRLELLDELKPKKSLKDFKLQIDSSYTFADDDLKGKVTLLSVGRLNNDENQNLKKIDDQFGPNSFFQIVTIGAVAPPKKVIGKWSHIEAKAETVRNFINEEFNPSYFNETNKMICLIDSSRQLRREYKHLHGGELNSLVEHLAIVLPRPPKSDVILDRKKDEE